MISKIQIEEMMLNAGLAIELESPVATNEKFSDLGLDSLDIFNIFVEVESLTGIQVPDDEIENLQTIDSIHAYIAAKGQ